jgi:hypothetical protein
MKKITQYCFFYVCRHLININIFDLNQENLFLFSPDTDSLVLVGKLNGICIVEGIKESSRCAAIKVLCATGWRQIGIKARNLRNLQKIIYRMFRGLFSQKS